MIITRPESQRGRTITGWLDSRHSFSFGDYNHPNFMGFRSLRVINEDRVLPGKGFPAHPHRDMEILTYVVEGQLAHKDSLGHRRVIHPGQLQSMTAGKGVVHSEFNPSETEPVHFLQIWIVPENSELVPAYHEWNPASDGLIPPLQLMASPDGRDGSVPIAQDVSLYLVKLEQGTTLQCNLATGRHGWIQDMRGSLFLDNQVLLAGDGAAITEQEDFSLHAKEPVEALFFDLA
jgi:redox-sensitive bicupin YhaK (pirin superfamily)